KEFQVTLKERTGIRIGIEIKHVMIKMKGILKAVVEGVEDTMVDLEDETMVVHE
ncbi:hypothetical protein KI387_008158, partial [Taxus chinensis]